MKKFAKVIFGFLVFVLAFSFLTSTASSKSYYVVTNATASPSPAPVVDVNSFELFWPLSPGKTMASKVYFLKTIKEDIRGMLIFGPIEKSDYDVLLATKRVLEAQALAESGNSDLANKTLDRFNQKLNEGFDLYSKGKAQGEVSQSSTDNIKKELSNLEVFLKWYSSKVQGDTKSKVDQGLSKVQEFLGAL